MGGWVADGEAGLFRADGAFWRPAGPPCRALCTWKDGVFCADDHFCRRYDGQGRELLCVPAESGVCGMECRDGLVYLLSSDADCVTARGAADGRLLYSAPAGVYPRGLCLCPRDGCLAVAGGAAGEILFYDGALRLQRSVRVPGVACGVCPLKDGWAALCAVGEEEVSALLLRISPRGVTEELFACPESPCCLTATEDGCAVGCCGRVYFLRPDGRRMRAMNCAYPAAVRCRGREILICDPWQGKVLTGGGRCVYAGPDPESALTLSP